MFESPYKALIAVSDTLVADTINHVLAARSIMDVVRVDSTHDAIDAMLHTRFDLFFVDARVPVTFERSMILYGGIDFIRFIRMCEGRVSEATVVFVRQHIGEQTLLEVHSETISAKNAGASCVITHPATVEVFDKEICPILERPRPFVREQTYTGPDRRAEEKPIDIDRRLHPYLPIKDR